MHDDSVRTVAGCGNNELGRTTCYRLPMNEPTDGFTRLLATYESLTDRFESVAARVDTEILTSAREMYSPLREQIERARHTAEQWNEKASLAVRAGDDDLARECLIRRRECHAGVLALEPELRAFEVMIAWLESNA